MAEATHYQFPDRTVQGAPDKEVFTLDGSFVTIPLRKVPQGVRSSIQLYMDIIPKLVVLVSTLA